MIYAQYRRSWRLLRSPAIEAGNVRTRHQEKLAHALILDSWELGGLLLNRASDGTAPHTWPTCPVCPTAVLCADHLEVCPAVGEPEMPGNADTWCQALIRAAEDAYTCYGSAQRGAWARPLQA